MNWALGSGLASIKILQCRLKSQMSIFFKQAVYPPTKYSIYVSSGDVFFINNASTIKGNKQEIPSSSKAHQLVA